MSRLKSALFLALIAIGWATAMEGQYHDEIALEAERSEMVRAAVNVEDKQEYQ